MSFYMMKVNCSKIVYNLSLFPPILSLSPFLIPTPFPSCPSCLPPQTTHLVVNSPEKARDSYKSRMAQKWGIPVVSMSFIDKYVLYVCTLAMHLG